MADAPPMIAGDHTFRESGAFHGMIAGSATFPAGVHVDLHGMVARDLIVRTGGSVRLHGMVAGRVLEEGSEA